MVAKRCCKAVPIWHVVTTQWIYVFCNVNLLLCSVAGHSLVGDRGRREVTTMLPEMPQGDMSPDGPLVPITDPCYPFVNVSNKQFFSPGYPAETYTNNTDCVVVLEAPEGNLIKLDFRDWFAIEPSPDCKNDFLEVRDGPHGYNTPLAAPFCGADFPPMLTSSDRHLWIHFRSDENIEYKGFKAVFEYIPRPPSLKTPEIMPCRIDHTDMEEGLLGKNDIPQEIVEFDRKHSMAIDCIWAITVRNKWRIQLQFQKFSLEIPNDCENNFVEVFSDRTDMPSLEKNFCGSIADTVLSKGNVMFVRFFSEAKATKSYFEANFTAFRENDKSSSSYKQGCDVDEFDCEDATCISNSLKCNGRYNCRFRWDEDECQSSQSLGLNDDHIIIIMVIFSMILTGMCFTFIYNCVKKLIRDHHTIQEYIRQSREHQLNELDKQETMSKKMPPSVASKGSNGGNGSQGHRSRSQTSPSIDRFDTTAINSITTPCYVPGGDILPILIRHERHDQHSLSNSLSNNGDLYPPTIFTVDHCEDQPAPEMCDSACQTRESLFTTQGYSSGNSTPNHSIHTNSPPAPFSTFGYHKKDNQFKAEAKIEMSSAVIGGGVVGGIIGKGGALSEEKRRPFSVQTTKSAPDVIVTH